MPSAASTTGWWVDLLHRRRRHIHLGDLEGGVERLDKSLVQEQVLVKGVRPFLVQLGETGLGVQVAEQGDVCSTVVLPPSLFLTSLK